MTMMEQGAVPHRASPSLSVGPIQVCVGPNMSSTSPTVMPGCTLAKLVRVIGLRLKRTTARESRISTNDKSATHDIDHFEYTLPMLLMYQGIIKREGREGRKRGTRR